MERMAQHLPSRRSQILKDLGFGAAGCGVPGHPGAAAVPGAGGLSPQPCAAVLVPRSPVPIHLPVSSLQLFS